MKSQVWVEIKTTPLCEIASHTGKHFCNSVEKYFDTVDLPGFTLNIFVGERSPFVPLIRPTQEIGQIHYCQGLDKVKEKLKKRHICVKSHDMRKSIVCNFA